jgi:DNA-binding MarR family transcriptional regulator
MRSIGHSGAIADDVHRMRELLIELGQRRCLRDPLASVAEESQLTAPQVHALFWLGLGPLTMGELAKRIGVTEKTVTGVADRLERDAYVRRERDEADRRVVRVRLAPKGLSCFKEIDNHMNESLGDMLSALGADDRRSLFRILEKLVHRAVPDAETA